MIRYISNAASLTVILSVAFIATNLNAGSNTPKEEKTTAAAAKQDSAKQDSSKSAPAAPAKEDPSNPILAKVGDKVIRKSDVDQKLQDLKKSFEDPENKANPALQELLDPKNKAQLAEKLLDGAISGALIEEGAKKIRASEEFKKTSETMLENLAKKNFLIQEADKKITDADIKEKYDLFIKSRPPEDQVFVSIIRTTEEAKAKEAFGKISKGEDFAKLAKEYSTDEKTKNTGGAIPTPIKKSDQAPKELVDAIFATSVGKVCDKPIRMETDLGQGNRKVEYLIFKVTKRETVPAPTLEQLKEPLKGIIRESKIPEVIDDLRKGAKVELFKYDADGKKVDAAAPKNDAAKPAEKK